MKDYDKSLGDLSNCVRLNPNIFAAYLDRGHIYSRIKKQYDLALADYERAVQLRPDFHQAHNNIGAILFNQKKDYRAAVAAFEQAIRFDPSGPLGYLNRSRCYYMLGQYDRAREDMSTCLRFGGTVPESYKTTLESL